jgi:HK97 family phage portal protein
MGLLDIFKTTTTREPLVQEKARGVDVPLLPLPAGYQRRQWDDVSWEALSAYGLGNAAVSQCITTLAFGYNEPPAIIVDPNDEPQPKHPLQVLLDRPNPLMSHAELQLYICIYKAIGGNAYLHKVRNSSGDVIELWPYHMGQMRPVPSPSKWVDQYEYYPNGMLSIDAERILIPASEIIHLKWPSIDLAQPWIALPPLRAVAMEVNSDTEMTRYIYALLANDAVARTVISLPAGSQLTNTQFSRLEEQFKIRHGGERRGGVGIVEGGATINRMALNLQELAIEALRRIPESRIAGALRVPAALAGLYVGLEKMTYSNFQEARRQFTEGTYVPLWKSDAIELTQGLIPEFGGGKYKVIYDTSHVAALHEEEGQKYSRILEAYDSMVVTKNEARAYLGYKKVGEIVVEDEGDTFKAAPAPPMAPGQQPTIVDVTPPKQPPPQLTDTAKALVRAVIVEQKAQATEPLQRKIEREVQRYLSEQYDAYANAGGAE